MIERTFVLIKHDGAFSLEKKTIGKRK